MSKIDCLFSAFESSVELLAIHEFREKMCHLQRIVDSACLHNQAFSTCSACMGCLSLWAHWL